MCEERYYRFLKEPKGVVPTILQNLLDARKNTRKQIKENQKLIEGIDDNKKIRDKDDLNKVLDNLDSKIENRQNRIDLSQWKLHF